MSGTKRTCYGPEQIHDALEDARRGLSWRTCDDSHTTGYLLRQSNPSHLNAMYIKDGRTRCEICGTEKRQRAIAKSLAGFAKRRQLYLTLVLANDNARSAVAKQLREKDGIGWCIPILGATALVSDIVMLSKDRTPYSIAIPDSDRKATAQNLTNLWFADGQRMSWLNWSTVTATDTTEQDDSEQKRQKKTTQSKVLGFTNTTLPTQLEASPVAHVQSGRWIEIHAGMTDPDVQVVLRKSNFKRKKEISVPEEEVG